MVVGRGGRGRGGGRGGGSRGGGRRGGSRGGRGGSSRGRGERGRGYRPRPVPTTENGDGIKSKPTFVKVKDIRPGNRSYDLIVKVTDSNLESTRTERRGGRQFTLKCSEALVGDETGCIKLSTRFPEKAQGIKDGITVVLLNVKVRRAQENAWIEVDNWGVIKEVESAKDIIPEGTKLDFEINKANDKSRKEAAKPKFVKVESLEPDTKGHNLIVKVKSVKVENRTRLDGTSSQTAEAVVGDDTSLIILIARGDQIPSLKEGKVVAIYNSRIVMSKETFMRLVVDRWSAVKPIEQVDAKLLPENHITEATVLAEKNRSDIEWVKED